MKPRVGQGKKRLAFLVVLSRHRPPPSLGRVRDNTTPGPVDSTALPVSTSPRADRTRRSGVTGPPHRGSGTRPHPSKSAAPPIHSAEVRGTREHPPRTKLHADADRPPRV